MKLKEGLNINDTGFVFDPETGESYTVNSVGLEMVKLFQEGKSREEVKSKFLEEYEVEEWTFEKAWIDFTALLKNYHLLEHVE